MGERERVKCIQYRRSSQQIPLIIYVHTNIKKNEQNTTLHLRLHKPECNLRTRKNQRLKSFGAHFITDRNPFPNEPGVLQSRSVPLEDPVERATGECVPPHPHPNTLLWHQDGDSVPCCSDLPKAGCSEHSEGVSPSQNFPDTSMVITIPTRQKKSLTKRL